MPRSQPPIVPLQRWLESMTVAMPLIVLVTALACLLRLFKGTQETLDTSSEVRIARLALISIVLAILGEFLLTSDSMDSTTLSRMLNNLAVFAGLPMLVSAVLSRAAARPFTMPIWGRWFLAIIALFELFRRMDAGLAYTQGLVIAMVAGVLVAMIIAKDASLKKSLALSFVCTAASAISWYQGLNELATHLPAALALWFATGSLRQKSR